MMMLMGILPFQLKKTDPLLQVCEDPLLTGHSADLKMLVRRLNWTLLYYKHKT